MTIYSKLLVTVDASMAVADACAGAAEPEAETIAVWVDEDADEEAGAVWAAEDDADEATTAVWAVDDADEATTAV